jgi:hypothetical protein
MARLLGLVKPKIQAAKEAKGGTWAGFFNSGTIFGIYRIPYWVLPRGVIAEEKKL